MYCMTSICMSVFEPYSAYFLMQASRVISILLCLVLHADPGCFLRSLCGPSRLPYSSSFLCVLMVASPLYIDSICHLFVEWCDPKNFHFTVTICTQTSCTFITHLIHSYLFLCFIIICSIFQSIGLCAVTVSYKICYVLLCYNIQFHQWRNSNEVVMKTSLLKYTHTWQGLSSCT